MKTRVCVKYFVNDCGQFNSFFNVSLRNNLEDLQGTVRLPEIVLSYCMPTYGQKNAYI